MALFAYLLLLGSLQLTSKVYVVVVVVSFLSSRIDPAHTAGGCKLPPAAQRNKRKRRRRCSTAVADAMTTGPSILHFNVIIAILADLSVAYIPTYIRVFSVRSSAKIEVQTQFDSTPIRVRRG